MNTKQLEKTLKQVNKLYVMYRKKYLSQYKNKNGESGYRTVPFSLNDNAVRRHLREEETVGVFAGEDGGLTKFIAFDVDGGDTIEEARFIAEELVEHLSSYYSIDLDKIHTSFSGGKGYHVTIFFDEAFQYKRLKLFYLEVIRNLGYSETDIEFRPTAGQGVKLPLSIHRKTGNYMNYMEYIPEARALIPMSKQKSVEYFNHIKPLSSKDFKEYVIDDLDITEEQKKMAVFDKKTAQDYQTVYSGVNVSGKTVESSQKQVTDILEQGTLTYPDTRHNATYSLLRFLRSQGYEIEQSVEIVQEVIANTYDNPDTREFIDSKTTRGYALSEVERLAGYVYKYKNTGVSVKRRDVTISKEEVIEILSFKGRLEHKRLLFSMLLHSKRYADDDGEFYMAYSVMEAYGNAKDRGAVLRHLKKLEEDKKILIVSRNELDTMRTKAFKTPIKKANVYKVTLESSKIDSKELIDVTSDMDLTLENVTYQLLKKHEARKLLTNAQWNHFKEYYFAS